MKTIKVGRGSNNDVIIKDDVISTSHAIITVSDFGEVTIEDLNSKNGTFVNGRRITKAILTSSSTVLLGNHSIDWKQIIQTAHVKPVKPPVNIPGDIVDKKLIGRNPMAQIRFSFDDVSDRHAYLCKKADESILLIDNNSTNGTYVNGSKIIAPYVLRKGDNVSISNRHPLNWEIVYPPKVKANYKLIASIAAFIIIIAGIALLRPWNLLSKDWSEVYTEHKNDVVLVYVKSAYVATIQGKLLSEYLNGYNQLDYCYLDGNGEIATGIARSTGTGFFISEDGKLLTNRHVVTDESEKKNEETILHAIQLFLIKNDLSELAAHLEVDYALLGIGLVQNDTYIDNENNLIPCTVLKVSDKSELDVALLQTNSKSIPQGSTYIDLSKSVPSSKLSLGDEICTIGFPQSFIIGQTSVGLEANNQSGEITQERGAFEYGHNITVHQGASGSPVYDRKGRFAGIIVSGFLGISQGYNHAIHPTPVIDFVNSSGIK